MKDKEKFSKRRNDSRDSILSAASAIIKTDGIDAVTVRRVCTEAGMALGSFYYYFHNTDDLLTAFIAANSFNDLQLKSPEGDIDGRLAELYDRLFSQYMFYGKDFMQSFFYPGNTALKQYMSVYKDEFPESSVMDRGEKELNNAMTNGTLKADADTHMIASDL